MKTSAAYTCGHTNNLYDIFPGAECWACGAIWCTGCLPSLIDDDIADGETSDFIAPCPECRCSAGAANGNE